MTPPPEFVHSFPLGPRIDGLDNLALLSGLRAGGRALEATIWTGSESASGTERIGPEYRISASR